MYSILCSELPILIYEREINPEKKNTFSLSGLNNNHEKYIAKYRCQRCLAKTLITIDLSIGIIETMHMPPCDILSFSFFSFRRKHQRNGYQEQMRSRKLKTRRSRSPNCIYALDHGRRRNDIKTPAALRRGRCIICRRVVKRFQLVSPCRSSSAPTHVYTDKRGGELTATQLNRAAQFFLIIRKSSLIHPGYIFSPGRQAVSTCKFERSSMFLAKVSKARKLRQKFNANFTRFIDISLMLNKNMMTPFFMLSNIVKLSSVKETISLILIERERER